MNKKILYSLLAVLLVLASIIALLVSNSKQSQDNIDVPEEPPILGDAQDVQENRPEDIAIEVPGETPTPEKQEAAENQEAPKKQEATKKPQTKPAPATAKPSTSQSKASAPKTYEDFMNMSSSDQQNFVDSFPSMDDFFAWYNSVKEVYEKENPPIEVGDGVINIDKIIKDKE